MSKYILFASQKNRDLGFRGMVYHLIFFESSNLLNEYYHFRGLIQEQRVSFINSWCHSLLLECHFGGCHSESSVHLFLPILLDFFVEDICGGEEIGKVGITI